LTVVAILALLAGLLFPALAGAKGKSRSIVCGNHLSQMGKALAMYEGDSGCYPGAGQTALASNMMIKPSEDSWTAKITPYLLGSTGVFSCPSYTPFKFGGLFANAYGYNANGCAVIGTMEANLGLGYGAIDKKHPLVRVGEVVNPADMIAIGDLQLPPGVWINVVSPNLQRAMGGLSSLVPSRHNGGANMTFCDGHVENARQSRWTEAADRARRQWNRDHEPHREAW
ncbi:MAG TPA: H-X9-DG-CTERM domain-containing protein, partial [Verrucomicrobiae bacterium]|nr:H-X9-DG-CTERM domain-containing protein [Verrucomicrobiae bacterium]